MKQFLPILLILASCAGNDDQPKTEKISDTAVTDPVSTPAAAFENVPQGFLPTKSLDDEALAQYADTVRQFYFVVDEEPSGDVDLALMDEVSTAHLPRLERYAIVRQQGLKLEHRDFKPGKIVLTKSGNNSLATFSFKDKVEGIKNPVFYQFSFIEGPTGIFTLTGWCEEGKEVDFLKEYQRFTADFNPSAAQ